jgi:hypothetical protein
LGFSVENTRERQASVEFFDKLGTEEIFEEHSDVKRRYLKSLLM